MPITAVLALGIFVAGYAAIALENRFYVNKAAIALVLASILWLIASVSLPGKAIRHVLGEASTDIFGIVVFLLTAMTLVEVLLHYHFFDFIEASLRRNGWTVYKLGWIITLLAFFLSAFLDNLTTTIVMIQIVRRLFPKEAQLQMGALVVISANAGGAFSPIGDITTIMLWFANKFTAGHVILQGFLPSLTLMLVASALLLRPLRHCTHSKAESNGHFKSSRSDRAIMFVALASFLLPLAASLFNLPPYLGLLAGLGVVWLMIDVAKRARPQPTHLGAHIKRFLQQVDIESIQFFLGILLAVAALHALGILEVLTQALLGPNPDAPRLIAAFSGIGLASALVDNVPLTAAAISSLDGVSASLWVLLAITVGTGGSVLVIGSAAGVIAMNMLERLTFGHYLRIAAFPALLGFVAAVAVWLVQYSLL